MNKKELEDVLKQIKDENRKLNEENIQLRQSATEVNLTKKAFSVIKNEKNEYKIVELLFDLETGLGKVVNIADLSRNNKDFALAEYYGSEYFINKIMQPLSE